MIFHKKHTVPAPAAPSWLTATTLAPTVGAFSKMAGVFYHAEDVRRLAVSLGPFVTVTLRIETTGEYAGAVRVVVDGTVVGSVPHAQAGTYRAAIAALHPRPATGWAELEADDQSVDVWLRATDQLRQPTDPALPPFAEQRVELDETTAAQFDAMLNSRAKQKRTTTTGIVTAASAGTWRVVVGDVVAAVAAFDDRRLKEALAAGWEPSCYVQIVRRPDHPLSVLAYLP